MNFVVHLKASANFWPPSVYEKILDHVTRNLFNFITIPFEYLGLEPIQGLFVPL